MYMYFLSGLTVIALFIVLSVYHDPISNMALSHSLSLAKFGGLDRNYNAGLGSLCQRVESAKTNRTVSTRRSS